MLYKKQSINNFIKFTGYATNTIVMFSLFKYCLGYLPVSSEDLQLTVTDSLIFHVLSNLLKLFIRSFVDKFQ